MEDEKSLVWRERIIDTIDARELNKRRYTPLTENVDYYTLRGSYTLKDTDIPFDVALAELETI